MSVGENLKPGNVVVTAGSIGGAAAIRVEMMQRESFRSFGF
jgi:2-keto-4-pentenoate hydratase